MHRSCKSLHSQISFQMHNWEFFEDARNVLLLAALAEGLLKYFLYNQLMKYLKLLHPRVAIVVNITTFDPFLTKLQSIIPPNLHQYVGAHWIQLLQSSETVDGVTGNNSEIFTTIEL